MTRWSRRLRAVLAGGTREEATATYQIGMTICESCRTTTQRAGGDEVAVDEATREQAQRDAQRLGRVDVAAPARATQEIPPRTRRAVLHRHGGRCAVCRAAGTRRSSTFIMSTAAPTGAIA